MANVVANALGLRTRKRTSSSRPNFVSAAPIELTRVGTTDSYASVRLWKPQIGPGTYGGQTCAQAAYAATQTVPEGFDLHSLHAHFLHAGDARHPIVYNVERLRDGKSYATRLVRAVQHNRICFQLMCSFHKPGQSEISSDAPSFTPVMPTDYEWQPEEGISSPDKIKRMLESYGTSVPKAMREKMATGVQELNRMPIDIVNAQDTDDDLAMGSGDNVSYCWIRVRGPLPPDPALQRCALIFASDWQVTFVVPKSLDLTPFSNPSLDKAVSLDHSMHIYAPPDIDVSDWILYVSRCPVASDGRGIARGEMWTRDGKLIAIITQEAHVRAAPVRERKAKL